MQYNQTIDDSGYIFDCGSHDKLVAYVGSLFM